MSSLTLQGIENFSAIWGLLTPDGGLISAGYELEKSTGFTQEELKSKDFRYYSAQEQGPDVYEHIKKSLVKGDVWSGQIKVTNKKNEKVWLPTTLVPLAKQKGYQSVVLAVRRDPRAMIDLEHELDRSIIQLEMQMGALDKASIVAITDIKGKIVYANENFCKISEYSVDELIGKNHRLISSGHHSKDFFKDLWQTILSGQVWKGEIKNKSKSGAFYWVDTTIVPIKDSSANPVQYVAIRNDITSRKEAEEMLENERARLIQSEKMASLGIMAAGIAHEIGNPLAALRGRLEMFGNSAKSGEVDSNRAIEMSELGIELVDRINRIIKGLRAYARDSSTDPYGQVDLNELVQDILGLTKEKSKKLDIDVRFLPSNKTLQLHCREAEIGQVLVNLLNNSFDAVRELDKRWIEIITTQQNGWVELSLEDSGVGISEDYLTHIFDPFYTTKPVGQGTGLGLSICNKIIRSHQGEFYYDKRGENTRFILRLPIERGELS